MNEAYEKLAGRRLDPKLAPFPSGAIDEPWYTKDAVLLLGKLLRHDFVCFEWGSGTSTIWLSKRVKHVTSIEHNEEWYNLVKSVLKDLNITNVDLMNRWSKRFEYTECIREYSDESFDVIIVDGAGGDHRRRAVIEAVPKLKTDGLLLVDDSHHLKCSDKIDFLRYWPQVDTFNNRRSTTFFFKPEGATNEGFRSYIKPE